jgi:hypothetical protein
MKIVIVGYGSYGKLIHNKYKLYNNITVCGSISKKNGTHNSIDEFINSGVCLNDIYFELCIPSDYIYETICKFIDLKIKNFIIPKTFTKSLHELDALVLLRKNHNLNIIVASQWYYSDITNKLLDIRKTINPETHVKTKIEFLHFIHNDKRTHYRSGNALLPHQIHILLKANLLNPDTNNTIIQCIENKPFRTHFIIKQANHTIEIINDFNSTVRKQTIDIDIENSEDIKGFGANFSGYLFDEGFHIYPHYWICHSKDKNNTSINPIYVNSIYHKNKILDPLENMIETYLNIKDNINEFYIYEKWIHYINIELSKNKALVIGGGIFGCLILKQLLDHNYTTTLIDKAPSYLLGASCVNQCRVHKGYHYPRDDLTANIVFNDEIKFTQLFEDAIVKTSNHYYSISKNDSKTTNKEYMDFMHRHNLKYSSDSPKNIILNTEYISNSYKVEEFSFDIYKLRSIIAKWLDNPLINQYFSANIVAIEVVDNDRYKVIWNINNSIYSEIFGVIVNSTYNSINHIHELAKLPCNIYQYELCEVFIIKAPKKWREQLTGFAVMDGPFCGIMSFGFDNDNYVLYDVELSVLETYIGILPNFNTSKLDDKMVRFNKLIDKMKNYFPEIVEGEYLYSMYQTRIVLPNSDDTDKRPTIIIRPRHNFWSLFSGKIVNSISASEQIINEILLLKI